MQKYLIGGDHIARAVAEDFGIDAIVSIKHGLQGSLLHHRDLLSISSLRQIFLTVCRTFASISDGYWFLSSRKVIGQGISAYN